MAGEVAYRTYSPQEAVDLVTQSKAFKDAIEGSQVGPILKSLLSGEIFIEALRSGVSGVASGGASGVAKGAVGTGMGRARQYEKGLIHLLTREYTSQQIKRQSLSPGFMADGLIFLPSRAGITDLMIQAYGIQSRRSLPLRINVK